MRIETFILILSVMFVVLYSSLIGRPFIIFLWIWLWLLLIKMVYSFIVAPMGRNRFRPRPSQELCPFEVVEWEKLRTKWNCTDPADYHCLPDQYNVPGQICVKPIWVLKSKYNYMVNHFPIRTQDYSWKFSWTLLF